MSERDVDAAYRIDQLWPAGGRVLIVAQAKTGKTTLVVSNLIPKLLGKPGRPWTDDDGTVMATTDGPMFLGRYLTTPVKGRIVYINVEVGEATLRRWFRKAGIPVDDRLHILNLRGAASSLNIGSESGRRAWSLRLRALNAEIVILDPVAPLLAALGLDENSNTDVATFWSWWGEMLADAGVVDDVVIHHAGHAGERSRGASRLLDEPDAIWTITKDRDETGDRYLEAMGRDVELSRHALVFDYETGGLTIGDARGVKSNSQSRESYETSVIDALKGGPVAESNLAKIGGNDSGGYARRKEWLAGMVSSGKICQIAGSSKGSAYVLPGVQS